MIVELLGGPLDGLPREVEDTQVALEEKIETYNREAFGRPSWMAGPRMYRTVRYVRRFHRDRIVFAFDGER